MIKNLLLIFFILNSVYLIYGITLDYNKNRIPITPLASLDSVNKTTLIYGQVLKVGKISLQLSNYGTIQLVKENKVVWETDRSTLSGTINHTKNKLILLNNFNLVLYNNEKILWSSQTENHNDNGPFYLTILEEGAYNLPWAIMLVNSEGKMRWGRFGPLIGFRVPLIPGTFLDSKGCTYNQCKLENDDFLTNGRDLLRLSSTGNAILTSTAGEVFYTTQQQLPNDNYTMVFEEGGTLVFYSRNQVGPYVYRIKVGNGRYLQLLPVYVLENNTTPNEWALTTRMENGNIHGGFFSNPLLSNRNVPNYIHQQKSDTWSGHSPLVSNFLQLEQWPATSEERSHGSFLSYFHIRSTSSYGYPDVVWSSAMYIHEETGIVNLINKQPHCWTSDGRFIVNLKIARELSDVLTMRSSRVVNNYNENLFTSPYPSFSNQNALVLSDIAPEMIHLDCSKRIDYCTLNDTCSCTYVWGVSRSELFSPF